MPTETISTAAGVVREDVGRWRGARNRTRRENSLIAKGDVRLYNGNLSVTYTRMRPYTVNPSIYVGPGNDEKFFNSSDRVAAQYVLARGPWTSESRFGRGRLHTHRWPEFSPLAEPGSGVGSGDRSAAQSGARQFGGLLPHRRAVDGLQLA